ncbi:hypothetical protein F4778DRAFT_740613 [Xylariomycetidae sp. FL2044]|nr:hypothetical protein F4778DRAFT_740613 [Xylariomycetidae sp. FL2044]
MACFLSKAFGYLGIIYAYGMLCYMLCYDTLCLSCNVNLFDELIRLSVYASIFLLLFPALPPPPPNRAPRLKRIVVAAGPLLSYMSYICCLQDLVVSPTYMS